LQQESTSDKDYHPSNARGGDIESVKAVEKLYAMRRILRRSGDEVVRE
jgi:hypothetical protein